MWGEYTVCLYSTAMMKHCFEQLIYARKEITMPQISWSRVVSLYLPPDSQSVCGLEIYLLDTLSGFFSPCK